jgi:chemotaxis protein MotB
MAHSKKHAASHANHERWLISYADFITLLFAFFVVMFASAQADNTKSKQVSDSVREALENGGMTATIKQFLGNTANQKDKSPEKAERERAVKSTMPAAAQLLRSQRLLSQQCC